jgi:hypothetical protein
MRSLKEVIRYEDLAFYEWKALATKCGGLDNVLAIIRGEKAVKIEDLIMLFDKNGRRIPPKELQNNVCDPNKDFYLKQPQINYADRLVRFQEAFHPGPCISAAEFEGKSEGLIEKIKNDSQISNLLKGVYLPIILSQIPKKFDYGKVLEQTFLSAVQSSYEKEFPNRKFYNHKKGELEGEVTIVPGTRHEKLIEKMKQDIIVATYFPNPLQGFSFLASREQMTTLPESLILAGGFDTASAMAMYPDVLARDWHTPGFDLAALQWQSSGRSLCLLADDDGLGFSYRVVLGGAGGYYSSGFLFLGSA